MPAPLQPTYTEDLPIHARREEIIRAIQENQIVVIAGETGSGKTTQIPKFLIDAGLGQNGLIGCTQPRRVAAPPVAQRIAEELGVQYGHEVGAKIRFTDQTRKDTTIKVMTDGILLNEIQDDPQLRAYDAIIIDEAHERSLNIDFILGCLRQLADQRKDLKIVITSATIDTESFSKAFDGAPIIEVSGRMYPVDTFYRPFGSVVSGWPATTGDWVYPCVAAVDLNGDYEPEIVVGSGDNQVYAWSADCALLPGFPVTLDAAIVGSIAAADLSGNGVNELVATTMAGSVYVLSAEGVVCNGWPKTALAGIIASPVVIDVDGDGGLDVVAASRDNWLYAWDADGTAISELTLKTNDWIESTPAAGDIDGDGLIEVVYASYDGTIAIVDLGSVASAANLAWPAFRGDRALVADAVVTDVDGDALPDALELDVFGNYAISGQNDEDGDGMTNAAEWIAGTSLLDVSDYFSVVSGTTTVGSVRQFELVWQANAGRRYKVYCSATLADEADWELADLQHASDDGEMSWTVDMPTGVPCQFFRVVVERGNLE